MATNIVIKQEGIFKKHFTFSRIQSILSKSLEYGVFDESYVLQDLENDDFQKYICVYDKNKIGRGFQMRIKNDEILLTLPIPCTTQDNNIFYDATFRILDAYKIKSFLHENEKYALQDIESLKLKNLAFLKDYLIQEFGSKGMDVGTFPAALYPIIIDFKELYKNVDDHNKVKVFDEYFERKQAEDVYYPSHLLLRRNDNHRLFGIYVLTEDVLTILPKKPDAFLTLGHHDEEPVWIVALGQFDDNDEFTTLGEVLYTKFVELINFDLKEVFFFDHIQYALSKEDIEKLRPFLLTEEEKEKL